MLRGDGRQRRGPGGREPAAWCCAAATPHPEHAAGSIKTPRASPSLERQFGEGGGVWGLLATAGPAPRTPPGTQHVLDKHLPSKGADGALTHKAGSPGIRACGRHVPVPPGAKALAPLLRGLPLLPPRPVPPRVCSTGK